MRYRLSFEFDSDRDPEGWYWPDLLGKVHCDADPIDWATLTLKKKGTWAVVPLDFA